MFLCRMEKVKISNSTIVFTIIFLIFLAILFVSRYLVLTMLIGIGLCTIIAPLLELLRSKLRFPKALSAIVLLITIMLLSTGILASIYFLVADQFATLKERSPQIYASISSWAFEIFNRYPWLKEEIGNFEFAQTAQDSMVNVLEALQMSFVAFSGTAFALIIGLYTAINSSEYFQSLTEAFPPKYRTNATNVLKECAEVLRRWFNAQILDIVIVGTLTGMALWAFNIEYWAIFGLLTAIMGLIPYIGILFVVQVAILITLASNPAQVPWVIFVFVVVQQLEGNFILPLVMKGKVELPIVHLLIFILFLGTFFGILGVFVAPPLFAVLKTIYKMVYLPYINKIST